MNSHEQNVSIFEVQLLKESEMAVSSLLGISVHIKPRRKEIEPSSRMSGRYRMVTWKWMHVEGQCRFIISDDAAGLFFPENRDKTLPECSGMTQQFFQGLASSFTKRLNQLFEETWLLETNVCESASGPGDPLDSYRIINHYDIYLGSHRISGLDIGLDPALLRRWWNRWQVISGQYPFLRWPSGRLDLPFIPVQPPAELNQEAHTLEDELPISAELGKTRLQYSRIIGLGPGDVVWLDKISGDPVDLYLNNNKFAEGCIVSSHGKIAIRLTAIGSGNSINRPAGIISS